MAAWREARVILAAAYLAYCLCPSGSVAQMRAEPRTLEDLLDDEPAPAIQGDPARGGISGVVLFPSLMKPRTPPSPDPFLGDHLDGIWSGFEDSMQRYRGEARRFAAETQLVASQGGKLQTAIFWQSVGRAITANGTVDIPWSEDAVKQWQKRHPGVDLPTDAVERLRTWRASMSSACRDVLSDYESVVRDCTQGGHLDAAAALKVEVTQLGEAMRVAGLMETEAPVLEKRAVLEGAFTRPAGGFRHEILDAGWGKYDREVNRLAEQLVETLERLAKSAMRKSDLAEANSVSDAMKSLRGDGLYRRLRNCR
jgi:hypothetical protein